LSRFAGTFSSAIANGNPGSLPESRHGTTMPIATPVTPGSSVMRRIASL
jgi:hypothetical protein